MSLETESDLQPLQGTALDTLETDQNATTEGATPDDDDGMLAGYKAASAEDLLDPSTPKQPEGNTRRDDEGQDNDQPAATQQQQATPQPTPEPKRIGRWTEDEVAARFADLDSLKKGQSSLAGHIGDLRSRLSGQKPREITVADLPGVVEEFGEQYAKALATDLNKLGTFGAGHAAPTQEEIDALVSARAAQLTTALERKLEKKAVLRAHKDADDYFNSFAEDGKTIVPGPKAAQWAEWMKSLPEARQQEVANSWDADVMIAALADCKKFHEAKTAKPGATGSVPAARQSRVERAVTPRGTGAAAQPVDEDPMLAGYREARSGRG